MIAHVILYLPGETEAQMLQTIDYLNDAGIQGIKLQLLHVLEGTDLAELYRENSFFIPSQEEYIEMVIKCTERLDPDIVIHRLTRRRSGEAFAGSSVDPAEAQRPQCHPLCLSPKKHVAGKIFPIY